MSNAAILPDVGVSAERPPSFQFYPRDFMADTADLPDRAFARYFKGLCRSWTSGCFGVGTPDEWRGWMGYLSDEEWASDMPVLCQRMYITPTEPVFWVQLRMVEERQKQVLYSEQQSDRATRGWRKRKKKMPAHSSGMPAQCSASASASALQNQHQLPAASPAVAGSPLASGPAVLTLPTNRSGVEWPVTESQLATWAELYPAVDVPQTLREIRGWCDANPTRRKTPHGMGRFVNAWLAREQNRG